MPRKLYARESMGAVPQEPSASPPAPAAEAPPLRLVRKRKKPETEAPSAGDKETIEALRQQLDAVAGLAKHAPDVGAFTNEEITEVRKRRTTEAANTRAEILAFSKQIRQEARGSLSKEQISKYLDQVLEKKELLRNAASKEDEAVLKDLSRTVNQLLYASGMQQRAEKAANKAPEAETTSEQTNSYENFAIAQRAIYRKNMVMSFVELTGSKPDDAWEWLQMLHNEEFALERALDQAYRRPLDELTSPEAARERNMLVDALAEVQFGLKTITSDIDKRTQKEFERNMSDAGARAVEKFTGDLERLSDIQHALQEGTMTKNQMLRTRDQFLLRAVQLEQDLKKQDERPTSEWSFDDSAVYEYTAKTIAELHRTVHELEKSVETDQDEPIPLVTPQETPDALTEEKPFALTKRTERQSRERESILDIEAIDREVNDVRTLLLRGEVDESLCDALLIDLSKTYAALADASQELRMRSHPQEGDNDHIARFAVAMHHIEDIRHELHAMDFGTEYQRRDAQVEQIQQETKRDMRDIEKEMEVLADRVQSKYGKSPEELIVNPPGIGKSIKNLFGSLMGKTDPLAEWQSLAREYERKADVAEPVIPTIKGTGAIKQRIRDASLNQVERERIAQRGAAAERRLALGQAPAKTEEEFFGGSNDAPANDQEINPVTLSGDAQAERIQQEAKQDMRDIEKEMEVLADRVQSKYGKSPEELIVNPPGIGKSIKNLFGSLMGKTDPLAEWQSFAREYERKANIVGPVISAERAAGVIKQRIRDESTTKAERVRITQRSAAAERRMALGQAPAKTEEEFFGGSIESPADDQELLQQTVSNAERRGVPEASELYRHIASHPLLELLSFGPDEYIDQLARVNELQKKNAGLNPLSRIFSLRRLAAAEAILQEMKDELLEHGINPATGIDMRLPRKSTVTRRKRKS